MKKRIAVIGAALSLMPLGQPLVIGMGAGFTSAAVMLSVPEKANAQETRLVCDVKTFVKYQSDENWESLSNRTWYLQIDRKSGIIITSWRVKNQNFKDEFTIISTHPSKLVATGMPYADENDVISLTLDLDSGRITYVNHFSDNTGYAFTTHFGRCQ